MKNGKRFYEKTFDISKVEWCRDIMNFSILFDNYSKKTIAPISKCYVKDKEVVLFQRFIAEPINLTVESVKKIAYLLTKIHKSTENKAIMSACSQEWDMENLSCEIIYNVKVPDGEQRLYSNMQNILSEIQRVECGGKIEGIIHGDFRIGNIRYDGNTYIAIDLDTFGKGEFIIDVGRFLADLVLNKKSEYVPVFLKEYANIMEIDAKTLGLAIEISLWAKTLWLKQKSMSNPSWNSRLIRTLQNMQYLTKIKEIKILAKSLLKETKKNYT